MCWRRTPAQSVRSRWSSPAPVRCGPSPSRGRWAPTRPRARRCSTSPSRPSTAARPASSRGRRSRHSSWPRRSSRASRSTPSSRPRTRSRSTSTTTRPAAAAPGRLEHRHVPQRGHRGRHVRRLLGHRAVGQHLLRPARAADRTVRAVHARQRDGHEPRPEQVRGRLASRWVSRTRARWRWPTPTRRSPLAASTARRPRSPQILDRDGKPIPQPTEQCKRVMRPAFADAVNARPQGVMQGQRHRLRAQHRPADSRQDRYDGRLPVGLVRRLHAQHGRRQRGRRCHPDPAAPFADRLTIARQLHQLRHRWRDRRPDLAAGDVGDRAVPARPDFVRPDPNVVKGQTVPIPSLYGYSARAAAACCRSSASSRGSPTASTRTRPSGRSPTSARRGRASRARPS